VSASPDERYGLFGMDYVRGVTHALAAALTAKGVR
jgi:hypothetical protein